nr:unnamed protein product [Callosobruchus chinensis]
MDDSKTLTDIITAAKSLETVQSQMDKYNSSKPTTLRQTDILSQDRQDSIRWNAFAVDLKDIPPKMLTALLVTSLAYNVVGSVISNKMQLQKGFKRNDQETNHQYSPTKKRKPQKILTYWKIILQKNTFFTWKEMTK